MPTIKLTAVAINRPNSGMIGIPQYLAGRDIAL